MSAWNAGGEDGVAHDAELARERVESKSHELEGEVGGVEGEGEGKYTKKRGEFWEVPEETRLSS